MDRDGELVGFRGNGCSLDRGRYVERPGLDARIAATGADVAGVRRLLGLKAVPA